MSLTALATGFRRTSIAALVSVLLLGSAVALNGSPLEEEEASTPPAAPPMARIATIGASVSAGFGSASDLKTSADVPLSVFIRAVVADGPAQAVSGEGSPWFFRDPPDFGKRQVDQALEADATLVIGVDFLFWYAFGDPSPSDPRRAKGLERGLAELDRIECPLVIGDLPDVAYALKGKSPFGTPWITRSMLPSDGERNAMNERIHAWAGERGNVAIVPVSVISIDMVKGRPMTVRGNEWTVDGPSEALLPDLLHLNSQGAIWLALNIADAATHLEGIDESAFLWDIAEVRKRLDEATKASRDERARKERKRKERREKTDGGRTVTIHPAVRMHGRHEFATRAGRPHGLDRHDFWRASA